MKGKTTVYESRESYNIREHEMEREIRKIDFDETLWTIISVVLVVIALVPSLPYGIVFFKIVSVLSLFVICFVYQKWITALREVKRLTMEAM